MKRGIKNNLSKEYILSKISQEQIISVYTGIDIQLIFNCIETGRLISSPFRYDKHPSFGFAYNNKGKLKAKDFAGYFWGDCFDIVAFVLNHSIDRKLSVGIKSDFYFILKHIANTFSEIIYGREKDEYLDFDVTTALKSIKNKKTIIEIVAREWLNIDIKIWSKWRLTTKYLNNHYVYPLDAYYINREENNYPNYTMDYKNPAYAYILGLDRRGIYNIQLYHPLADKKRKFISNTSSLFGLLNLNKTNYDYIIITKSYKDCLALDNYVTNLFSTGELELPTIGIISLSSEIAQLRKEEYEYLKNLLSEDGQIISFFDMDLTGINKARELKKEYGIDYILIPNGKGLENYHSKDFTELLENYSNEIIDKFIIETFKLFNNAEDI
jgi:hypothetical protein